MYRLIVQVTVSGRQTVADTGVVRSCDPLQNFWGSNHMTGMAEPTVVKFCTQVACLPMPNFRLISKGYSCVIRCFTEVSHWEICNTAVVPSV